jgi:hypothetical protein
MKLLRVTRLGTSWMIAWGCLAFTQSVGSSLASSCLTDIPTDFWNFTVYEPHLQRLRLNLKESNLVVQKCLEQFNRSTTVSMVYKLQLIAVQEEEEGECCDMQCESSTMQDEIGLHKLSDWDSADPFSFGYVQGSYILRLVEVVTEGEGTCEEGSFSSCVSRCSPVQTYGAPSGTCDPVTDITNSTSSSYDLVINQSLDEHLCNFEFEVSFPVCAAIHPYTTATISVLAMEVNSSCPAMFLPSSAYNSSTVSVTPCVSRWCRAQPALQLGSVSYSLQAGANYSYCLWVRLNHPQCSTVSPASSCMFPVTQPATCSWGMLSQQQLWLSEPIFIALVCSVLCTSLLCLCWIVVKCTREQGTSLSSSPEPDKDIFKNKNMPRSLTIDEMEHIIRLRQQELVLVYFPDTEKFKNLNRKFRDWLMSLNILNVNDVTDVYDEKYCEGPDGILKNPESWVSNLLSDPERRVVLVTSKLAYECLIHLRKGLDPPKFPENDNYSSLLIHLLKFLDSDMFRGNYRRLICVRYEDLKICDRRFGSESFNIVPGTEYLLPQHLEDIARWIHPIEARPGLWADHRPQVRQLLECIRAYRHHEDNIFTVSFYNGAEDRPLLGNGYMSGY